MSEDISVVDFETKPIRSRPNFPPQPVGVAIRWPSGQKEYLAWGHPEGNNCDVSTARQKLRDAYACKQTVFHHSSFDIDVGECHFGLKPQGRVEDTLFLAFLKDPYTPELGLKELAVRDLDQPATERDAVKEWIAENINDRKAKGNDWGDFIWQAPGKLVGKYAIGDVDRTYKLHKAYMPEIEARGMRTAYERELACAPITMEMERSGVRIHRKRLRECRDVFEEMDRDVLRHIAKKLRVDPKNLKTPENKKGFNLNSSDQLGDALMRAGKLERVIKTPGGKISTKMENLRLCCNDKDLLNLLGVHSVAEKYLTSFIRPWLEQASIAGGRILPKFNQVRGYDEGGGGARTGRFSSSDPNLQNVSANVEESKNRELLLFLQKLLRDDYQYDFIGLRDYILPDEDCVMICVDYDQQELRLLAHFEKGILMKAYLDNPKLDVHEYCRQLVKKAIGIEFPRKFIKITVFGLIYGMGLDKLQGSLDSASQAEGLGVVDKKTAAAVKDGILEAIPGIKTMMSDLKRLANHDKPMHTWGGREYYCEEPKFIKKFGRWMSFEYKLFNYMIQASAADVTKQGMINVYNNVPNTRIAVQVHDELMVMAPSKKYGPRIAEAMCDMKFRVPMTATPKSSTYSWARAA